MSVRSSSGGSVRISSTGNNHFEEYVSTTMFVERSFGFQAQRLTVSNDAASAINIDVSYDGATVEGSLRQGETKEYFPAGKTSVHLKADSGTPIIRIWAE